MGVGRGLGAWAVALLVGCGSGSVGQGYDPGETETSGETDTTASTGESGPETSDAASGSSTGDPTDPDTTAGSTGEPPDDPGDPFEPLPEPAPLPDGDAEALAATLAGILDGGALGGATVGALVVDLETGQVLFERNADTVLVPASNTKMFTTAAMLDIVGPDTRIETEVWADAEPDGGGTIAGDLHLLGHHDVSWSTDFYGSARDPLDRVAQLLYDQGVRTVTGGVVARGEFIYEGYSLGTYDAAGYRATAVARFADALGAAGITVQGGTSTSPDFDVPGGASELLTWLSPPLSSMAVPINVRSHNEFADLWLRHLGYAVEGISTYGAGGAAVVDWMASLPTDNTDAVWNDGSGLSHGNRTSPRNIVDLIGAMEASPQADRWMRSMAIAGVRGTLASRMTGASTVGRFWGKTGTLPSIGVVTLSGVLYHRHDGRRYAVSILLNGVPNVDNARVVQNQIVEALAVDHRAVGPRPQAPVLQQALGDSDSTVVELEWTAVDGADGYVVWLSPDGTTWSREDARLVSSTSHRAGELPFSPTYVRVTAMFDVVDGPVHSTPSDVYAARSDFGGASILVVDGNDRWAAEPVDENPRGVGHHFAAVHGAAIADAQFDTCANEAIIDGAVELSAYDVVLWGLGEEGEVDETFSAAEQAEVTEYLGAGGALFVSGAELGYDLAAVGVPADAAFLGDVLGAGYQGDDAGTPLAGAGEGIFEGLDHLGFLDPGLQEIAFPDQLAAASGSTALLSYRGGSGGVAAVARDADAPTVVLGFPFEAIDNADDRAEVMSRVLAFFGR